jgi:hypothetical protein
MQRARPPLTPTPLGPAPLRVMQQALAALVALLGHLRRWQRDDIWITVLYGSIPLLLISKIRFHFHFHFTLAMMRLSQ